MVSRVQGKKVKIGPSGKIDFEMCNLTRPTKFLFLSSRAQVSWPYSLKQSYLRVIYKFSQDIVLFNQLHHNLHLRSSELNSHSSHQNHRNTNGAFTIDLKVEFYICPPKFAIVYVKKRNNYIWHEFFRLETKTNKTKQRTHTKHTCESVHWS